MGDLDDGCSLGWATGYSLWGGGVVVGGVRALAAPFVVPGPSGVAVRDRLKHLTAQDERVLRAIGEHQGALASRDLKVRCTQGLEHGADTWAARKRGLTKVSSSRISGAITKGTHDQWALARRCQAAHIRSLEAGIRTLRHRLSLPLGAKGTKRAAGGYRSKGEWFRKSRRLADLETRHTAAVTDWRAGRVRVVRGGKHLLNTRHHLAAAGLTEEQWRGRWEAERWFLAADGESGKRFGNETIRVTPTGQVSIKLPAPWPTSPTPHTGATPSPTPWRSRTGVWSGPTASKAIGPSPTASTSTPPGAAGI